MRDPVRSGVLTALLTLGVVAVPAGAQLLNVPLPALGENLEMLILEIELEPGEESEPHRHNAHVFVYVVE